MASRGVAVRTTTVAFYYGYFDNFDHTHILFSQLIAHPSVAFSFHHSGLLQSSLQQEEECQHQLRMTQVIWISKNAR